MSCRNDCNCPNLKNDFKEYIESLISECHEMSIYLVNGIRLDGKIIGFDESAKCIWISNAVNQHKPQIIFLSAVSTISFAKQPKQGIVE
jgi:RNA chaperone Hfq